VKGKRSPNYQKEHIMLAVMWSQAPHTVPPADGGLTFYPVLHQIQIAQSNLCDNSNLIINNI
jgi:hypothetical protein